MLKDGKYLVKHKDHKDGIPEREIVIKNELVSINGTSYLQNTFFSNNIVIKCIQ